MVRHFESDQSNAVGEKKKSKSMRRNGCGLRLHKNEKNEKQEVQILSSIKRQWIQ